MKVTPFSELRHTQVTSDVMHNKAIFLANDKLHQSTKLNSKSSTKGSVVHFRAAIFTMVCYIGIVTYPFFKKNKALKTMVMNVMKHLTDCQNQKEKEKKIN